jgi:3-deoxy-D-manno-octulosonic-acid transferase
VRDAAELEAFVRTALEQSEQARALGERARRLVLSQQGATARTGDLLCALAECDKANALRRKAA